MEQTNYVDIDPTVLGFPKAEGPPAYALGFSSLEKQDLIPEMQISGNIPAWLNGSLVLIGPGKFEIGADQYRHWFDGLAMLHRFSFTNGALSYANRFLESGSYRDAIEQGRISRREFAVNPRYKAFGGNRTLWKELGTDKDTDNGNGNVIADGDYLAALTETPYYMQVDPHTLAATQKVKSAADIEGQVSSTHPRYDKKRNKLYNFRIHFGRISRYNIFSTDLGTGESQLLHSMVAMEPAFMHSFAMTENYLVLVEPPLIVKPIKLRKATDPYFENYKWYPKRPARFIVISKDDGRIASIIETDPFFCFHQVNAYEENGEIVLDVVAYKDAKVVDELYLDRIRTETPATRAGVLRRFRLPISKKFGTISGNDLLPETPALLPTTIENPRINDNHDSKKYRYVYGAGIQMLRPRNNFLETLLKVDVENGTYQNWFEHFCYPSEPVFVPAPGATDEDDGVLLSVVLQGNDQRSFLVVLDARSMKELGRASLPHHVPFPTHARFFTAR
jgi:beta,beta-carotene 9',10'-dioxygenase